MIRITILLISLAVISLALGEKTPEAQQTQQRAEPNAGEMQRKDSDRPAQPDAVAAATRGVLGGVHDFSRITGRAVDACAACHIPHVLAVGPSERDGHEGILDLYRIGGQREVLTTDKHTPGPSSLICLSCHNGTIASSTIGTAHAIRAGEREGYVLPDGWAARDHAVGVAYPRGRRDYEPLAALLAGGLIRLPAERVECVSCHDPHNAAGIDKMLVMSNRRSALCLACHKK